MHLLFFVLLVVHLFQVTSSYLFFFILRGRNANINSEWEVQSLLYCVCYAFFKHCFKHRTNKQLLNIIIKMWISVLFWKMKDSIWILLHSSVLLLIFLIYIMHCRADETPHLWLMLLRSAVHRLGQSFGVQMCLFFSWKVWQGCVPFG